MIMDLQILSSQILQEMECTKKVIAQILKINPKRIIYVSCNSATQSRDLELLKNKYHVIKIQTIDMFPQTHHVENILVLESLN